MEQEQAKQEPEKKRGMKETVDMFRWHKQGLALYEAFIAALDSIPNQDVQSDVVLNAMKHVAVQNVEARLTSRITDDELVGMFKAECERFSKDLLAMPERFREVLKETREETRAPVVTVLPIDLMEALLGSCNCEHCLRFAKGMREEVAADKAAEAPTEPPPPPDGPIGAEAPLG